jgi:hypothetical protein
MGVKEENRGNMEGYWSIKKRDYKNNTEVLRLVEKRGRS